MDEYALCVLKGLVESFITHNIKGQIMLSRYFVIYTHRLEDDPIVEGEFSDLEDANNLVNEILDTYEGVTDAFVTEILWDNN